MFPFCVTFIRAQFSMSHETLSYPHAGLTFIVVVCAFFSRILKDYKTTNSRNHKRNHVNINVMPFVGFECAIKKG